MRKLWEIDLVTMLKDTLLDITKRMKWMGQRIRSEPPSVFFNTQLNAHLLRLA